MEALLPLFKALSERNRMEIIRLLLEREHCVCELMDLLGLSQATVSHHVRILKREGLLNERRSGKWHYYSLHKEGFARQASILKEMLFDPVSNAVFQECPAIKGKC